MTTPFTSRLATLGGAVSLVLGGTAAALAATAPTLPEQAADQAVEATATIEAEEGLDVADDIDLDALFSGESTGDATAFSTWVESLPEDWGCVRGALVSAAARGDHRGEFEGPSFETAAEAAEALGLEGQCVDAVTGDAATADEIDDTDGEDDAEDGRPEDAGKQADDHRPEDAGKPDAPGKPDDAGAQGQGRN